MKEKFGVEYTLQREDQRQKLRNRYKSNEKCKFLRKTKGLRVGLKKNILIKKDS